VANIQADRVLETSTTTGTGNLTVSGALTGFRAFGSAMSVGDSCSYAIWGVDASGNPTGEFEDGIAVYVSANTLQRYETRVSSNSNAPVSFSAGTKYVALALIASNRFTQGDGLAQQMGWCLP
jgi:hypothetical protein